MERKVNISKKAFDIPSLPISERRNDLLSPLRNNQVLVLEGLTASGKSSQMPAFLYEAGYGEVGIIAVTQPRRIAATSLSSYVKSLFVGDGPNPVAHHIRFSNTTNPGSRIIYYTDGELLEVMLRDPTLSEYSVVMVDEAHERSLNIDILLGLLKDLLKRRPEFRVIISSATFDAKKFSEYFDGAPVVNVTGRMHEVEVKYSPFPHFNENKNKAGVAEMVAYIADICRHDTGDILVFVPGKDDITDVMWGLEEERLPNIKLLPAYGRMEINEQEAIFLNYPGYRKGIVATPVAETSITVGVRHVVDCGLVKVMTYIPSTKHSKLEIVPCSRASADQRKGRAGRTASGVCHRLYAEDEWKEMKEYGEPEILRSSLSSLILTMKHMGLRNVETFDFIDRPNENQWMDAYKELRMFGALDERGILTEYGLRMATLPLDPYIANLLLAAEKQNCTEEMATVAAFLSSQNVLLRPPGEERNADDAHVEFEAKESDAFTWLRVWDAYQYHVGDADWCAKKYLSEEALIEIGNIRKEVLDILRKFGMKVSSRRNSDAVGMAILSGLKYNLFRKSKRGSSYFPESGHSGREIFIHPGSSVYLLQKEDRPHFIVVGSIVETTRTYGRFCTVVKRGWLSSLGISVKKEVVADDSGSRKNEKRNTGQHKTRTERRKSRSVTKRSR